MAKRDDPIRRRTLLGAVAGAALGASAGCLGGTGSGECADPEITAAHASVEYWCDYGPAVSAASLRGTAEDCLEEATVEVVTDGEVRSEWTIDPDGEWSIPIDEAEYTPGPDGATVRVRGPDGEVAAEERLEVDHYLDEPSLYLEARLTEPEDGELAAGESIDVTLRVGNTGGGTDYVATLLVDGEPVASREGAVEGGPPHCTGARGPEHAVSHAFDEPGEYEVAAAIRPAGTSGDHDERTLETVTVREASD